MMIKILILCTGNSCRSQMAEGFLKSLDERLKVFSAGTKPADIVNPFAEKGMKKFRENLKGIFSITAVGYKN